MGSSNWTSNWSTPQLASVLLSDLKKWAEPLKTVEAIELRVRTLIEGDKGLVEPESVERLLPPPGAPEARARCLEVGQGVGGGATAGEHPAGWRVRSPGWPPGSNPQVLANQRDYRAVQSLGRVGGPGVSQGICEGPSAGGAGEPRTVAERIAASPARMSLVAALDDWADVLANLEFLGKLREEEKGLQARLLEIARLADPDTSRRPVSQRAGLEGFGKAKGVGRRGKHQEAVAAGAVGTGLPVESNRRQTGEFFTQGSAAVQAGFLVVPGRTA